MLNIKQVRAHFLAFDNHLIDETVDLASWSRFSSIISKWGHTFWVVTNLGKLLKIYGPIRSK